MSVGIKELKAIQKQIEDLRIEQHGGISIEIMDEKLHSIEMEVFKLMDKTSARERPKLKNSKLPLPVVIKSVCGSTNCQPEAWCCGCNVKDKCELYKQTVL
jgi:hypothetical protein